MKSNPRACLSKNALLWKKLLQSHVSRQTTKIRCWIFVIICDAKYNPVHNLADQKMNSNVSSTCQKVE